MSPHGHIVAVQGVYKPPLQPDGAPEDTACELSTTSAPLLAEDKQPLYSLNSNQLSTTIVVWMGSGGM